MFATAGLENNNDFTPIDSKNNHSIKVSSLFHFVEELIIQKHAILSPYQIKKIEAKERVAYLIQFPQEPENKLFVEGGFKCIERHLTIDKFYSTNATEKSRIPLSHYTEIYTSQQSQEKIIIHVYFDTQGQLISIQVKKQIAELPASTLPIDDQLENKVKDNAVAAMVLLRELLKEKTKRFFEKTQEARELESTLDSLSYGLNNTAKRDKYIATANAYIKVINRINFYNDLCTDLRDVFVKKILQMLTENSSLVEPSDYSNVTEVVTTTPEVMNETATLPQKPKSSKKDKKAGSKSDKSTKSPSNAELQEQSLLLEQLLKLEGELDALDFSKDFNVKNVIKAQEISQDLHVVLANLVWINGFETINTQSHTLQRVETKLKALPNLLELLMRFFVSGEVDNFVALYNFSRDKITYEFCFELLQALTKKEPNLSLTDQRIAICDVLFQYSDTYRAYIIFSGSAAFAGPSEFNSNNMRMTLLGRSIALNNTNLFSMLLRHGCNAQLPGMIYQGSTYPLLKLISFLSNNAEFVTIALEYGAIVDRNETVELFKTLNLNNTNKPKVTPVPKASSQRLLQNSNNSEPGNQREIDMFSCIGYACRKRHYSLIPALAPSSDILNVAIALAEIFTFRERIGNIFIPISLTPGIICLENKNRRSLISSLLFSANQTLEQVSYIIYSDDKNFTESTPIITLCNALREKFKQCSSEKIWGVLQSLQQMAKVEKDAPFKRMYYMASLFIMCQKTKMSVSDKTNLIITYYALGHVLKDDPSPQLREIALLNYKLAVEIVYASSYREQLLQQSNLTKIIQISRDKISETKYDLKIVERPQNKLEKDNAQQTVFMPIYNKRKLMRFNSIDIIEHIETNPNTGKTVNAASARSRSNSV